MNNEIKHDIEQLTCTIEDADSKPLLRSTIELGLRDLGHAPKEAAEALDQFFHKTIH